jgi:hypothetical protein
MNETITRAQAVQLVNQLTDLLPTLPPEKRGEVELFVSKIKKILMESNENKFLISK